MSFRLSVISIGVVCTSLFPAYVLGGTDSRPEVVTIQQAVQMAMAGSPEVKLADARLSRARDALRETRSLRLPQVITGTGLAYNNGFPLSIEGSAPSIFEIVANQSIFSKTNNNLIREAEESGKASRFGKETARSEIASKTALAYYELYQAKEIITFASRESESAREQEARIATLLESGKVRPIDLTMARIATQKSQQRLLVAREQEKIAEAELHELIGLPDEVRIRTVKPQVEDPIFYLQTETVYQQALESAPEILQAESNVRAKEFHVEADKGERLPKIGIVSHYALFSRTNNYQDYFRSFTRNNYILGFSLQVPLFDGFRTSSKIAQSRQEVAEARYHLQQLRSDLKLDIQRELSALKIARGEAELARSEVEAARENLQVNESLFESGRISAQELEELRSALQQKELARFESDWKLFQRKISLLRVAGRIAAAFK